MLQDAVPSLRMVRLLLAGARELTFAWWLLAWDCYAIAAAMLEQMSFAGAMTHKQTVAQLAAQAQLEGKSVEVAVVYDRLLRRVV